MGFDVPSRLCARVHEWLGFAVPGTYHMSVATAPVGASFPDCGGKRVTGQVGGAREMAAPGPSPRPPSPGWPSTCGCCPVWAIDDGAAAVDDLLRGAGPLGRRQLGEAPQGPVLPRLLRHPRRRVRRRHADRGDQPHPGRAPGASGGAGRPGQSRSGARRLPRVRRPRLRHLRAVRCRPGRVGREVAGLPHPAHRRRRRGVPGQRRHHRRDRHPGERRPGGRRHRWCRPASGRS